MNTEIVTLLLLIIILGFICAEKKTQKKWKIGKCIDKNLTDTLKRVLTH